MIKTCTQHSTTITPFKANVVQCVYVQCCQWFLSHFLIPSTPHHMRTVGQGLHHHISVCKHKT